MEIHGKAAEPAYLYLAYFNGSADGGRAIPLNPRTFPSWSGVGAGGGPRMDVSLGGGAIGPTPSTETIFLLGRRTPLPASVDAGRLLAGYPQPALHVPGAAERSIRYDSTAGSAGSSAEAAAARWIDDVLRPHFDLVRTTTFATAVPAADSETD